MCTCANSLLLVLCNTWLCAVSSSLWCIWWPSCGTRVTFGNVTFSRSLNVILCGSCNALSCLLRKCGVLHFSHSAWHCKQRRVRMKANVVVSSGWALEDQTRWFLKLYGGTLSKVWKWYRGAGCSSWCVGCRSQLWEQAVVDKNVRRKPIAMGSGWLSRET